MPPLPTLLCGVLWHETVLHEYFIEILDASTGRETCRGQIKGSDKEEVRHLALVSVNIVNTGGLLGVGSRIARVGIGEIGN